MPTRSEYTSTGEGLERKISSLRQEIARLEEQKYEKQNEVVDLKESVKEHSTEKEELLRQKNPLQNK